MKTILRAFQVPVALVAVVAAQARRPDGSLAGISAGDPFIAPSSGRLVGFGFGGATVFRSCCRNLILINTVTPVSLRLMS